MFTEQDRKCTYNATPEARSDTSYVKLMTGMAATSLPWQLQDALVIGVRDRAIFKKKMCLYAKYTLLLTDFNHANDSSYVYSTFLHSPT